MSALAWLDDLARWFARWVPRLVLIEPTYGGVLFGPRGSSREVGPGLVLYWPITHTLVQIPVTTQSIQPSAQLLPALEDTAIIPRVLLCAAAIQFRVVNPVQAAIKVLNLHALVDNRSQAAIARTVHLRGDVSGWAGAVLVELRDDLHQFGVAVDRFDFVHHGIGVALKNVSDWNYQDTEGGKRPSEEKDA